MGGEAVRTRGMGWVKTFVPVTDGNLLLMLRNFSSFRSWMVNLISFLRQLRDRSSEDAGKLDTFDYFFASSYEI